jgi:hypothetical protein
MPPNVADESQDREMSVGTEIVRPGGSIRLGLPANGASSGKP